MGRVVFVHIKKKDATSSQLPTACDVFQHSQFHQLDCNAISLNVSLSDQLYWRPVQVDEQGTRCE